MARRPPPADWEFEHRIELLKKGKLSPSPKRTAMPEPAAAPPLLELPAAAAAASAAVATIIETSPLSTPLSADPSLVTRIPMHAYANTQPNAHVFIPSVRTPLLEPTKRDDVKCMDCAPFCCIM
jgi:hypothetical protein